MDNLARIIHELKAINTDLESFNNKQSAIGETLKKSNVDVFDDPYPEIVKEYLYTRTHEQLYDLLLEIMTLGQVDDLIDRIEEQENE